jgi:hypothetical protein
MVRGQTIAKKNIKNKKKTIINLIILSFMQSKWINLDQDFLLCLTVQENFTFFTSLFVKLNFI